MPLLGHKALAFVEQYCRPLEYHLLRWLLGFGNAAAVVGELSAYQNPDGGFGHGLEPDFWLPDSSPMATSRALQILVELPGDDARRMEQQAVSYLDASFDRETLQWESVPASVNEYPHAPWWHYSNELSGHWGNPTAELIGYCAKLTPSTGYWQEVALGEVKSRLLGLGAAATEEHELYCFNRCLQMVPQLQTPELVQHLAELASRHTARSAAEWVSYRPQPLHYVTRPDHILEPYYRETLPANFRFWEQSLSADGVWHPNWQWGQYEEAWATARLQWIGVLTAERAAVLRAFGRL